MRGRADVEEMTGNPRVLSPALAVRKAPYEHTTCWQNKKTQYHGYTVTAWTVGQFAGPG